MRRRYPKWVRHASDLGWCVESNYTDFDQDAERDRQELEWNARAAERLGLPAEYLGSRLHDGRICAFEVGPQRLQMAVSHEDFEWLGLGLDPVLGRAPRHRCMPILYDLKDCSIMKTYKGDVFGNLRPISLERVVRKVHTFLYAGVVPGDHDTLLWACILLEGKLGHVILLVESATPSIHERHREAWLEAFGPEWLWVHDAYDRVKDEVKLVDPNANAFLHSIGVVKP